MGTPILREENALRASNVDMFQEHACSQEPCQNGGRCNPMLDAYECVCLSGFSGGRCQNSEYLCQSISAMLLIHVILYTSVTLNICLEISMIGPGPILAGLRSPYHGSVKWQRCNRTNCSISSSNTTWFHSVRQCVGWLWSVVWVGLKSAILPLTQLGLPQWKWNL